MISFVLKVPLNLNQPTNLVIKNQRDCFFETRCTYNTICVTSLKWYIGQKVICISV